jgi:chromosome segregation ATPase
MASPTLGMKRHFNFEEFEGGSKRFRTTVSPRKAEASDKFAKDVQSLHQRHPSINVDVISTILETCENNTSDASASLKLFEADKVGDDHSTAAPQEDILADLPSLAERLASAIRTSESPEKGIHVAQTFVKGVASTITAAESKAQRNLSAAKALVRSLHQHHERSERTETALRKELASTEERAVTAERAAELLRWHLDQSSRSYYPGGFGGGPSAGGVF